jgi:hypothetical protein
MYVVMFMISLMAVVLSFSAYYTVLCNVHSCLNMDGKLKLPLDMFGRLMELIVSLKLWEATKFFFSFYNPFVYMLIGIIMGVFTTIKLFKKDKMMKKVSVNDLHES